MPDMIRRHPDILLPPTAPLRQAMESITRTQVGIALIVDENRRLLGIVVDSDIRRALLRGETMDAPADRFMNPHPFTLGVGTPEAEIAAAFRRHPRAYIPIIDGRSRLVELAAMTDYMSVPTAHPQWVVIMAGGQGTRLRPLTSTTPKPMMRIGDKPLLELLITRLISSGFTRFILSVNYLADQIKGHFGDGSSLGAQIEYIDEPRELGTAGALSLIAREFESPFLVMNGDLLTKVNFEALLEYHRNDGNLATICLREYDFQVPYGVVTVKDHKLSSIIEKPVHRFFVNAGIYVFEPSLTRRLERGIPRDMPDFLESIRASEPGRVGCFPIQEYWLDIGKMEDYQRAQQEYDQEFLT